MKLRRQVPLYHFAKARRAFSVRDVCLAMGIADRTARHALAKLARKGVIVKFAAGHATRYVFIEDSPQPVYTLPEACLSNLLPGHLSGGVEAAAKARRERMLMQQPTATTALEQCWGWMPAVVR
jgi:hypothetical protein